MTVRIMLALTALTGVALTYPWAGAADWWTVGVAVAVLVVVFAWWRGQFVTAMVAHRIGMWRRRIGTAKAAAPGRVTVLVRVQDRAGIGVPVGLVAGYVKRFGIRADKVRITTHERGGVRTTWIGVTLAARDNLAALQARSAALPLADTAAIVGRRLADQLRETGLAAAVADGADVVVADEAREMWTGMRDSRGVVSAYEVPVDEQLVERLDTLWQHSAETWTALEFSGRADELTAAAVCAIRSAERIRRAPLPGLITHNGRQGTLIAALAPESHERLGVAHRSVPPGLLDDFTWPVAAVAELSRT